jgi:hypothetical protein
MLLIPVWALVAGLFVFLADAPASFALVLAGTVLGVAGGIIQHLGLVQASDALRAASSLLEVRRCFKSTRWGRRSIWFLYLSRLVLLALAFLIVRTALFNVLFSYLAGEYSLRFTRELVTLRDTFRLHRTVSNEPTL